MRVSLPLIGQNTTVKNNYRILKECFFQIQFLSDYKKNKDIFQKIIKIVSSKRILLKMAIVGMKGIGHSCNILIARRVIKGDIHPQKIYLLLLNMKINRRLQTNQVNARTAQWLKNIYENETTHEPSMSSCLEISFASEALLSFS